MGASIQKSLTAIGTDGITVAEIAGADRIADRPSARVR